MTHDEADAIAKRIINCWRGGPPLTEWIEELQRLDAGTAGTTYARLKRTSEHAPSIAKFVAEYNALDTHDAGNRVPECRFCDGTGWLATLNHQARGIAYTGCEPCNMCSEGRAREVSETWTKSPVRDFVTDAEAERLVTASRERTR